ncbi:MAG: hypothetical protein WD512_18530, partial [Candidatus Paceibacterota bacterium]
MYFQGGNFFANLIQFNPLESIKFFFSDASNYMNLPSVKGYHVLQHLKADDSIFMSKVSALFCLIGFNEFLTSSMLFTLFCSIGSWLIFVVFSKLYPSATIYFAIGTLFFPTLAIWSSGILKDPITLMAIGLIFYSTYKASNGKGIITSLLIIAFAIYICMALKPYVLYIFIPTMLIWTQSQIRANFKSSFVKNIIKPLTLLLSLLGGYLLINEISKDAGKYSIENLESVVKGFHSWHDYLASTRDQSGYTLGEISYTPIGILSKVPEGVFVTFFRPFPLFDTRNIATWFEAIQSFSLLIVSIYVILRAGFLKTVHTIYRNKDVTAFIFFALVFGFAVGFTSYNFGALSRYKIPCLPFYTAALAIIYHQGVIL